MFVLRMPSGRSLRVALIGAISLCLAGLCVVARDDDLRLARANDFELVPKADKAASLVL